VFLLLYFLYFFLSSNVLGLILYNLGRLNEAIAEHTASTTLVPEDYVFWYLFEPLFLFLFLILFLPCVLALSPSLFL
jgi:hypothetical protein